MKTIASILTLITVSTVTGLSIPIYLFIFKEFGNEPNFLTGKDIIFNLLWYSTYYLIPFSLAVLAGILVKTFLWANAIRKAGTMLWLSALSFITGTISYLAYETINAGYFCTTIIMNGFLDASIWGIVIFVGFIIALELFFRKEEDLLDESEIYQ